MGVAFRRVWIVMRLLVLRRRRVTQWGSFLRRGVHLSILFSFFFYFHESVAYGKAVKCGLFLSVFLDSDGQPLHRSPVEGAGLHMLPFLYILYP